MEEIEKMLNENGQFNLDDIQVLLDELAYNYDIAEESKEELNQYKEDTNTYAKMYNEFNRNLPEYAIEIRNIEEKIAKLDAKQQRLKGRISKREVEERIDLEQQLNDLKQQYVESKNNRIESRKGYTETKAKYEELVEQNKQGIAEKQHQEYASKLESICKYCLSKMREKDDKLAELHKAIKNCVDPANANGYISEYSKELDERNQFYSNYEKVVKMIAESEEYQSTVGKDLVAEISRKLEDEKTKQEIVEPEVVETTKEETVEPEVVETEKEETVEPEVVETEKEETVEPEVAETEKEETIEPIVDTPVVDEPTISATIDDYWKAQYPKMDEVQPYSKDMSAKPMTLEQLAAEEPIFRDEERMDKEYDYMSYQNAQNLGLTNENTIEKVEEPKEEKVGFFKKIKEKINKEDKEIDNVIVNIDYAPEGLFNKLQFKINKCFMAPKDFEEWCQEKAEKEDSKTK